MKINFLFSILGMVAATAVSQAQPYYHVGSSSDTWNIDRTTELSGSQTSQNISDTANDNSLVLNRYNGGLDLARVVITIIKPLEGGSSVIETV